MSENFNRICLDALAGKPEATIDLNVFRGGQLIPVQLTLKNPFVGHERPFSGTTPPASVVPSAAVQPPALNASPVHLGATVNSLSAEQAKAAGVDAGLVVGAVDPGSVAQQIGVKAGDILLEINGKKIVDANSVKPALASGMIETVKVSRKGKVITLATGTKI